MTTIDERPWFTRFPVESDDRSDSDAVWADAVREARIVREPTYAERRSIALVGVFAIGGIVLMVVTLIVAVYISRR